MYPVGSQPAAHGKPPVPLSTGPCRSGASRAPRRPDASLTRRGHSAPQRDHSVMTEHTQREASAWEGNERRN